MRLAFWLRLFGAFLGVGVLGWFLAQTDREALTLALAGRAAWLPICVAFEVTRVVLETQATRSALGKAAGLVPLGRLLAIHFVGYAVSSVLPMPRPTAEATKASLLAGTLGLGRCVRVGLVLQASTLLAVSLASALFGALTNCVPLRRLLFLNFASLFVLGSGLLALTRWPDLHRSLARRWPRWRNFLERYGTEPAGFNPLAPAAWLFLSVVLQSVLFGLLLRGHSSASFLLGSATAEGAHLVTASVAAAVPSQLGVREVAFAEVSASLGTSVTGAAALSLLPRAAQLVVSAFGFAVLACFRPPSRASEG